MMISESTAHAETFPQSRSAEVQVCLHFEYETTVTLNRVRREMLTVKSETGEDGAGLVARPLCFLTTEAGLVDPGQMIGTSSLVRLIINFAADHVRSVEHCFSAG